MRHFSFHNNVISVVAILGLILLLGGRQSKQKRVLERLRPTPKFLGMLWISTAANWFPVFLSPWICLPPLLFNFFFYNFTSQLLRFLHLCTYMNLVFICLNRTQYACFVHMHTYKPINTTVNCKPATQKKLCIGLIMIKHFLVYHYYYSPLPVCPSWPVMTHMCVM